MVSVQNPTSVFIQKKINSPQVIARLYERGITDEAIEYARIHANGSGWLYPIAPSVTAQRWKAFDSSASPKYLWQPVRPDNARFYDPRGQLALHIAAAGGVLILASGEPDTWVGYSAGFFNVTCTLHGEGTIPDWFVPELHRLGVKMLRLGPDCDAAGLKHAARVAAVLAGSGIAVEMYALPYADDSKADLNTLWLDCTCDRTQFMAALEACPPLELPTSEQPQRPRTDYTPPAMIENLREHYCTDYVERAAVSAWQIAPPNGKGLSRKNFSSPLRDDQNPSAQWNYAVHGFKDYGNGGEFYNTDQVADLLGLSTWAEYKQIHPAATAAVMKPYLVAQSDPILSGRVPKTIARRLIAAGLHSALIVWNNGLSPTGLTRRTFDSGIDQLASTLQLIFVQNETPISAESKYVFQNVQKSERGRPARVYEFIPLADVLNQLEAFFIGQTRARCYQDAPSDVQGDFADPPLSADQIAALDAARTDQYAAHADQRETAEEKRARDLQYIRQDFVRIREGRYMVFEMPDGITSAADLRRALYGRTLDDHPEGIESYKLRRAAGISRATQSRYRQEYETITIPQHSDIPVSSVADLTLGLHQTAELVAPDGTTRFINGQQDIDEQTRQFITKYQRLTLRVSRPNIEKRSENADPVEHAAYKLYSAQQRRRAGKRGKRTQGESPKPKADVLRPTGYTDSWLEKQLSWTTNARAVPWYDPATGEVYTAPQRWRLMGDRLTYGQKPEQAPPADPKTAEAEPIRSVDHQPGEDAGGVVQSEAHTTRQPGDVPRAGWHDLQGTGGMARDYDAGQPTETGSLGPPPSPHRLSPVSSSDDHPACAPTNPNRCEQCVNGHAVQRCRNRGPDP